MERPTQHLRHTSSTRSHDPDDQITPSHEMSRSQSSYRVQTIYSADQNAPHDAQAQPSSASPEQMITLEEKKRCYRPTSTTTPILSAFLFATLVFIAGLEFILRRGIPITPEASVTPAQPQHLISSEYSNGSTDHLGYGMLPFPVAALEPSKTCIGIEMIISLADTEEVMPVTYTNPIYNIAIPTMPCYACAMRSQSIAAKGFITATTVSIPDHS